jgi:hypothetical protein
MAGFLGSAVAQCPDLDVLPAQIHRGASTGPSGTTVAVHGSGFLPTTTATANGSPTTVTFVDPDTLNIIMPGVGTGSVQVTVTNPTGQTYSLDDAFIVQ